MERSKPLDNKSASLVKRLPAIGEYVGMAIPRQRHRLRPAPCEPALTLESLPRYPILPAPFPPSGHRQGILLEPGSPAFLQGVHPKGPAVLPVLGPELLGQLPVLVAVAPPELPDPAGAAAEDLLPGKDLRREKHRVLSSAVEREGKGGRGSREEVGIEIGGEPRVYRVLGGGGKEEAFSLHGDGGGAEFGGGGRAHGPEKDEGSDLK